MALAGIQLTTEALLGWVIVAIGLLGFIVAHTIQKWYKAILPGLLALAMVGFGLYCVIKLSHKPEPATPHETEKPRELSGDQISGLDEQQPPPTREDLTASLTAYVPDLPDNPFYMREQQSLKVTVRIRNRGTKPVTTAVVTCYLPLRSDPRRGARSAPHRISFNTPLQPGAETDAVVTIDGVAKIEDYSEPRVVINEAY